MQTQINIEKCEKTIGYTFKDKNLLIQCFTHASYANEHKSMADNERLEFFGDSILGFIVTEYLYNKYKNTSEGDLTAIKQNIVSKKPLSKASINNGFDEFLLLGEGQKQQFLSRKENLCENLFESIIAGIYIDGGIDSAKNFVYEKLLKSLNIESINDYKSALQQYVQKRKLGDIDYETLLVEGPSHKPIFTVSVFIGGEQLATEKGQTKQQAQQNCAKIALKKLTNQEET